MLTRLIRSSQPITTVRVLSLSALRFGDGDHTRSKAEEKAAQDLKTRKEKRWLDTTASDSEAIVKGEKQFAKKAGNPKKNLDKLQQDTISAIQDKQAKGHLPNHDVGRGDTREERIGSAPTAPKQKKK